MADAPVVKNQRFVCSGNDRVGIAGMARRAAWHSEYKNVWVIILYRSDVLVQYSTRSSAILFLRRVQAARETLLKKKKKMPKTVMYRMLSSSGRRWYGRSSRSRASCTTRQWRLYNILYARKGRNATIITHDVMPPPCRGIRSKIKTNVARCCATPT